MRKHASSPPSSAGPVPSVRSVGQGRWVASYLPGRTLTDDQALAAIRAAEKLNGLEDDAALLGLTVPQLVGLVLMDDGSPQRLWPLGRTSDVPGPNEQRQ